MNIPSAKDIFTLKNLQDFECKALEVFAFQAENNPVYRDFIRHLRIHPGKVKQVTEIPFLPISFFKSHEILTAGQKTAITFTSSGTTGSLTSRHPVADVSVYEQSYRKGFESFYGPISDYTLLALLPNYSEREGSSLIYMVDDLMQQAQPVKKQSSSG